MKEMVDYLGKRVIETTPVISFEIAQNNCIDTSGCYLVTLTNVEPDKSYGNFSLYPNPTNGQFFIDLNKPYRQTTMILTDITGHIIIVKEYQNIAGIPMKLKVVQAFIC